MKKINMLLIFASFTIISCSQLPIKTEVKQDHFRIENFIAEKGTQLDLVHLMCFHKRPTEWSAAKQYVSGEHVLWVKASIAERGIVKNVKEAFVQFKVKLDPGKSYMLNRSVKGDQISIWIQESETETKASDIIVADLKQPLLVDYNLRQTQCREGSV